MNFVEYVKFTDTVALYPKEVESQYLALGVADELGELVQERTTDGLLSEMGDCFWYLLRYSHYVLGADLEEWYSHATDRNSLPVDVTFIGPSTRHAGVICGYEKKKLRDGATWDAAKAEQKKNEAILAACMLIMQLAKLCAMTGHELEEVLEINVQKLSRRKAAGTIKGDGSDR